MVTEYSIDELDSLNDEKLKQVDWRKSNCLNGRLLELYGEGELGNELLAKLPLRPILCIDQINRIDDECIEASFTFPDSVDDWAFDPNESLEMLFQDQLDQLVGFWGSRKADGIGRALSSGACKLHQSLDFQAGRTINFILKKRKWVENKNTGTSTAVFSGKILDGQGNVMLETNNVIVGILPLKEILALREEFGGKLGVDTTVKIVESNLQIPIYAVDSIKIDRNESDINTVTATQVINPALWPLKFHFRGDPVVPGNFGTHGMISLLKEVARKEFGMKEPQFMSMASKRFTGMIFEDPKQIRFELTNVTADADGNVVAGTAGLYLETKEGERMIESPIYTFKKLTVSEANS